MTDTLTTTAHGLGLRAQGRASDPAASAWVSANAGTGKTRVLTDRVARLLLAGTDPRRLLCLTFTRAAAAEMQERVFDRLGGWATLPDVALEAELVALGHGGGAAERAAARRLFARALDIPGGLKIQTIHAFCEGLLKRFPVEAGVPPHFTVLDESGAAALLAAGRARVLDAARTAGPDSALGRALALVVEAAEETAFRALMDELVTKRGALACARARHGELEGLAVAIRALLRVPAGVTARDVLAAGCADAVLPVRALRRAAAALAQGGAGDTRQAARLVAFLDAPDRAAAVTDYCAVYLTVTGERRRVLASRTAQRVDAEVEPILRAEQERVCALLADHRAALVAEASEAAFVLGGALLDAYDAEKAARAALDYEDLILKTRDLLRERADAGWILSKLDGGIDHVLIDEAQDTSPEQWQVVEALTEEFFAGEGARPVRRTVFAVGDEKQSIYGFQGADPHAFGRMRDFFAARVQGARFDWRDEALALSFRSTPEILKAVDLVFDQARARAGLGRADRPIRHSAFRAESAGLVEIWPTIRPQTAAQPTDPWDAPVGSDNGESPMARLAARIADTVADWLRDGVCTADGEPLRPGDILILVRRRNAFVDAMVQALKQRGVPVAGADRLRLTDQLAVKDLVAFGRCLLQPEDDLTLAAVLRGPLVGLSEEGLFALAHGRSGTLWQALERAAADGGAEAAAARALLTEAGVRAAGSPPFDFYSDLLGPLGGRRALAARLGPQANDPIDAFIDAALRYEALEPPSLEGFLHAIEVGAPEIRRDYEHGRDEARVMTVHGAKGLEANVVFLADTCAVPNARHDPKLIPAGPDGGLLLWPIRKANDTPESARGRQAARAARDEEHRRLLYVAMTRARDRLYVCGYETARSLPPDCWYRLIADALVPICAKVDLGFDAPAWRLGRAPAGKATGTRRSSPS